MAITIGQVNLPNRNHVIGNRREVQCDVTLDSSYPTGGYTLTPATLGVDGVTDYIIGFATTTGHTFTYNYATSKLMAWNGTTQIANAVDLSAVVVRVIASGKGSGL